MTLYTIGHSDLAIEDFLAMLREHGVEHVVDVRSAPYSRHVPQYNRDELAAALEREGLRYTFEGASLGGRPTDPSCYRKRRIPQGEADYLEEVDYAAVMAKPWFVEGIRRLMDLAAREPTAILCSELDPLACHRHHLIAAYLERTYPDVEVRHIVPGGCFSARGRGTKADEPTVVQHRLF